MFKSHADVIKNILYITIQGKVNADEVQEVSEKTIADSKKLKPGFGVISDISTFIPTSEEGRLTMQNTMKTLKDSGMKCAVRVVPSTASVPSMQFQRTSRAAGYEAAEAPTLAEAEALLTKMMQS